MNNLSATIVTLNEAANIARAIASVKWAAEVIVLDSGSQDATREIAEREGARVIQSAWQGYVAQKNFAATLATNDWILSLDADEALSPDLALELQSLHPAYTAYDMPRRAFYLGRWIGHSGWYPDRKIRLYHRAHATWQGGHVHESVQAAGPVGHLHFDLLHYTCNSLGEHLTTLNRYTTLAAKDARPRSLAHLALSPFWTFLNTYIVHRGFQDGPQGLAIAWMAALYTFLKYAKARGDLNP